MNRHYLDHASTSPPRPSVTETMLHWLQGTPGAGEEYATPADPGRVHTEGRQARAVLEDARDRVADFLGTRSRQVIFASSGTEAVNAAVWGATRAHPGSPILLAEVEHSSVREASRRLTDVVSLPVDIAGRIDPDAVIAAIADCGRGGIMPALVHCQAANHEVGTLQRFPAIVEICREQGIPVHVDACAAAGRIPLQLDDLGADLVSISAHKLGGPPGIGALVIRRGLRFDPLLVGGEQERARRGGLENIPAIVGFAAAAELLADPERMQVEVDRDRIYTDRIAAIGAMVPGVSQLGDPVDRLPDLICLAIDDVEAEPVLLGLDQAGIAAHSGSSCASESLAPSPVLEAMGVSAERSLRLSVGWSTTEADIDAFAEAFPRVVGQMRALRH